MTQHETTQLTDPARLKELVVKLRAHLEQQERDRYLRDEIEPEEQTWNDWIHEEQSIHNLTSETETEID